MVRKGPRPADDFPETQNLVTTNIASDDPRAINERCKVDEFDEVLEIPVAELQPEMGRTNIAIDLTPPDGQPILSSALPGFRILRQKISRDSVPWIMVTLFDTRS